MLRNTRAEASLSSAYTDTKIGKLPSSWKVASLADVTDPSAPIRYGVVQIGPHTPDGVPIVPIKHIRRISHATLHRASPDIEAAYAGSRVKGGDVLISVKGTIGDIGVVPGGFEGNIAREIARIRPKPNCDADFLSFQLQADHTQRRIDSKVVGSTRLEFSIHAVRDFLIALPPRPEQRKIAKILRTWDKAIEKLEALRAAKERRAHALAHTFLRDFLLHSLKAREAEIMRLRVGSGLPNIQRADLERFLVRVPPYEDQRKIARLLDTARQEITLISAEIEALSRQKRGLMQKLLTGEWRVAVEAD